MFKNTKLQNTKPKCTRCSKTCDKPEYGKIWNGSTAQHDYYVLCPDCKKIDDTFLKIL